MDKKIFIRIFKLKKPNQIILQSTEIDLAKFPVDSPNIAKWIDRESIVIWDKMKYPLIVKRIVDALDLAKLLGVSSQALRLKASRLKLKKPKRIFVIPFHRN